MAGGRTSESVPRAEPEALLCSAASYQQERQRVISFLPLHWMCQILVPPSKEIFVFMKYKVIVQVEDKICG